MRLILVVLIAICFSCKSEVKSNDIIKIKPSKLAVEASNLFDDFEIIPLEGLKKSLIGEVTKIVETKNIIYVLDQKQEKLFLFSENGEFLNSLQNIGKGPNEYLTLDDFIIYGNTLFLLSRASRKLFQYSLTGKIQKTINIEKQYSQLAKGKGSTLVFYRDFLSMTKDDFFNIEVFDLKSETVIKQFSPFIKEQNGELSWGSSRQIFATSKNKLFLTLPFQHKIFEVDKKGLSNFLAIDFGSENDLPDGAENFSFEEMKKNEKSLIWNLNDLNINDVYVHFSYIYRGLKQDVLINRNNNFVTNGYITADDKIPFDLTNRLILNKNKILTFTYPELFNIDFYKKQKIATLIKNKGYSVEQLSQNNNPIILKFNIKNRKLANDD